MAIALDLRCAVTAELSESWSVDHVGTQRPPTGSEDAVLASARLAVGPQTPLRLSVDNQIPIGRGLGSSSAAMAAGALAAWRAKGTEPPI